MSESIIKKQWNTKSGLPARIVEHPDLGHLCGYVGVDKDSGFYQVEYSTMDSRIGVHGGVTFSGTLKDSDLWWIGYDCAHSCDYTKFNPSGIKRDVGFCTDECEDLARQICHTPLDYFFRAERMGKLAEELHNKMIAWAIENPEDTTIKEYFEKYGKSLS